MHTHRHGKADLLSPTWVNSSCYEKLHIKTWGTHIQGVLKGLGQLDEALDNQVTEFGKNLLVLLLQLLRRAPQQHHQSQERVCPAQSMQYLPRTRIQRCNAGGKLQVAHCIALHQIKNEETVSVCEPCAARQSETSSKLITI